MNDNTSKIYQRKQNTLVTAVQINLDIEGFTYNKWGGPQRCQSGDWLVQNNDDCYTVANDSFLNTYQLVSPGQYRKHTHVRATRATAAGAIPTREGQTAYQAGDYLVSNLHDNTDTYAITEQRFHELYEPVDI